jgi:hypothetical protein
MASKPLQSPALQRAASRELERLVAEQRRIEQRLEALEDERAKLRDEQRSLSGHAALLKEVLGGGRSAAVAQASAGVVLRGAKLREEAARVLLKRAGPNKAAHYATWLDWVVEDGFIVLGKRPKSTFLTGATRSVLVRRGDEPGTYLVAPDAIDDVMQELAEKRAELKDVDTQLARDPDPSAGARQHRVTLLANIRRLEGQLTEAERVLMAAGTPARRIRAA